MSIRKKIGHPILAGTVQHPKMAESPLLLDQTNSEHLILQPYVVVFDITSATTADISAFHCTVTMVPHASLSKGILTHCS
jgi:hypothetical protein